MPATHLILFAANLTLIVTHLYGWLLKWFYRPKAYGEHFRELFPAQRIVGATYLLQIFELPYLLQIGEQYDVPHPARIAAHAAAAIARLLISRSPFPCSRRVRPPAPARSNSWCFI